MDDLVIQNSGQISTELETLAVKTLNYRKRAKTEGTRKAYQTDWTRFEAWCESRNLPSMPAAPETVALYLSHHAETRKPATLARWLASISVAHKLRRLDSPTRSLVVTETNAGIRNEQGTKQRQAAALPVADLRRLIGAIDDKPSGVRDRAMILLQIAGAFRRSELAALDVADLAFTEAGIVVTVRRSKTDQTGEGREVLIRFQGRPETCPVRAVKRLMDSQGGSGALFQNVTVKGELKGRLCDKTVCNVLKRRAAAVGLDPALISGHTPRVTFCVLAAEAGEEERRVQRVTGHKSTVMLRRYMKQGSIEKDSAVVNF